MTKLVILTGPTAVGKTALSIRLAKEIGGEIISADSMQVYRRMNIGTAKIREEEKEGVIHHLIDICEPTEEYHVVRFAAEAKKLIREISNQGKIPIIVGGTGFYIQAVLYDVDFTDTKEDTAYRLELLSYAAEHGAKALHDRLSLVDPGAAEKIHENNVKRVIRALEFYAQTGKRISEHNELQRENEAAYQSAYFVLTMDRSVLYDRINQRIDSMMNEGLVEEVKGLISEGCTENMVSMQGLGYKEFFPYLKGEISLPEAVEILKRDTRHFAKRQMTWFRRERDVFWLDKSIHTEDEIFQIILSTLKEEGILE